MDLLLNALYLVLMTAPLVALVVWRSPHRRWAPALLFLALLAVDDLATVLPFWWDAANLFGGDWNWEGKMASVAWAVALLALGPIGFREAGVTLRQRPGSVHTALLAALVFTACSFGIGLAFGGGPFSAETLAFQLTMPGLAEELVYRGVFIALLHRALPDARGFAAWWPVLITSFAFALVHGLSVDDGRVSFDMLSASFPFLGGLAYGWIRERTGSILIPTLAHNLGNTAALIGGFLSG